MKTVGKTQLPHDCFSIAGNDRLGIFIANVCKIRFHINRVFNVILIPKRFEKQILKFLCSNFRGNVILRCSGMTLPDIGHLPLTSFHVVFRTRCSNRISNLASKLSPWKHLIFPWNVFNLDPFPCKILRGSKKHYVHPKTSFS